MSFGGTVYIYIYFYTHLEIPVSTLYGTQTYSSGALSDYPAVSPQLISGITKNPWKRVVRLVNLDHTWHFH